MPTIAEFSFYLKDWSGWLPGVETKDEWQQWAIDGSVGEARKIQLPSISPTIRRRLSPLGKMVFSCALKVIDLNEKIPVVFSSRYGEICRSEALLEDVYKENPLSPNTFSMSVHNGSVGLLSIVGKNHSAMTAIAASDNSFEAALIEAYSQLKTQQADSILVLIGEEIPDTYCQSLIDPKPTAFGMALLLSLNTGKQIHCHFDTQSTDALKQDSEPRSLSFIRWLLSDDCELELPGYDGQSLWTRP
jgi:hypothetical protein